MDPRPVRDLAALQHGAVARWQGSALGMTARQVEWRLEAGHWVALHRGVYLTQPGRTGRLTRLGAAVLACGEGAALSFVSAAYELGLLRAEPPLVDVLVPARRVTWSELPAVELARRPRHRRRALLADALQDIGAGAESTMEVRFSRDVLRAHGLPPGRPQLASAPGRRHDVGFEAYRVLVELDGLAFHSSATARLADTRRILRLGGWPGRARPCRRRACALRGDLRVEH